MRTQHAIHALPNFPVWSIGFISDTRLVLGGGGGSGRSGVKNKLRLYEIQDQGNVIELVNESELEKDEDAPMTMAVHPMDGALVCGVNSSMESLQKGTNQHCRLYVIRDNALQLERKQQTISAGALETYQHVTTFSKDFNFIAVGSTENEVVVLSYPSLSVVATPFHIPSGQLYGLDFSPSSLLVTTDTMLYMISLPLKITAKAQDGPEDEPHKVKLPELEIEQQIPLPSLDVLGGKGDRGAVRVFRAGRFNPLQSETMYTVINSAPPSGRSRNSKAVERKSYLVRWERATAGGEAGKGTWHFKKARNIGKRAVTVFDISESGKLLAYGASDASVGILDARTFAPLLTILKAHDFPPTALQFNPRSSLLVSGSADASIRVMVIPVTFSSSSAQTLVVLLLTLLAVLIAVLIVRAVSETCVIETLLVLHLCKQDTVRTEIQARTVQLMPTVDDVMDAFKNLIRHGKHARAPAAQPAIPVVSPIDPSSLTKHRIGNQHLEQDPPRVEHGVNQRHQEYEEQAPHQQQLSHFPPAILSPQSTPKEAAEYIVKEEREAKSKMPNYPGLEHFRLIEKMGDGAFSNVYKAIDRRNGQKVAVKVVHKYELNSSQAGSKHLNEKFKKRPRVTERTNILKEVQIMRGSNHPSIVKLLSFSESEEHFYLVLELMEGGELFHQIVKLTYFSENLARHVILQVAHGIRYLHEERGVVHRDIKPENLLFERIPLIPSRTPVRRQYDEDKLDEGAFIPGRGGGEIGLVKIADFGLSKVVWSEDTATPCGTVGYTAPEIVKDERYSKSVDMWALGCVLYTLLCGFPPFYDESITVLTEKVAKGHYTFLEPWWDEISVSAKNLITHLLCVDPAERYSIDEFLAHPWCRAVPAPPPLPTHAVDRPHNAPLDSPLLDSVRRGRPEGRSPGLSTLKEAFDVTYAVHRMEEEGARRRAYNGPRGAGALGFLHELNEDDEEEEAMYERSLVDNARRRQDIHHQEQQAVDASVISSGSGAYDGRAGTRDLGGVWQQRGRQLVSTRVKRANGAFELDMAGATLLGRRHRRAGEPSPLHHALVADQAEYPNTSSP